MTTGTTVVPLELYEVDTTGTVADVVVVVTGPTTGMEVADELGKVVVVAVVVVTLPKLERAELPVAGPTGGGATFVDEVADERDCELTALKP